MFVGSLSEPGNELTEQNGSSSLGARRRGGLGKESGNHTGFVGSRINSGRDTERESPEHLHGMTPFTFNSFVSPVRRLVPGAEGS